MIFKVIIKLDLCNFKRNICIFIVLSDYYFLFMIIILPITIFFLFYDIICIIKRKIKLFFSVQIFILKFQ